MHRVASHQSFACVDAGCPLNSAAFLCLRKAFVAVRGAATMREADHLIESMHWNSFVFKRRNDERRGLCWLPVSNVDLTRLHIDFKRIARPRPRWTVPLIGHAGSPTYGGVMNTDRQSRRHPFGLPPYPCAILSSKILPYAQQLLRHGNDPLTSRSPMFARVYDWAGQSANSALPTDATAVNKPSVGFCRRGNPAFTS
jgi:hypothetical protein